MIARTEASQLDFLSILDLLRIAVSPLDGDIGVCVGIYQDVECAIAIENREKGD